MISLEGGDVQMSCSNEDFSIYDIVGSIPAFHFLSLLGKISCSSVFTKNKRIVHKKEKNDQVK